MMNVTELFVIPLAITNYRKNCPPDRQFFLAAQEKTRGSDCYKDTKRFQIGQNLKTKLLKGFRHTFTSGSKMNVTFLQSVLDYFLLRLT